MQIFNLPRVSILGTNDYGKEHREAFRHHGSLQDVLCCCDYAEEIVASFYHQIKAEYYGGNRLVSIEGIALENFSALQLTIPLLTPYNLSGNAVFYSFWSDNIQQYSSTTPAHSKHIIKLLKKKLSFSDISTIWDNTDGVVLINTDVILLYIYCQFWNMHIIL